MIPGEILAAEGEIELNPGRERTRVTVANRGDRPIQVGAHSHLFEVNSALAFDGEAAYGQRLDIPAGTALRFEPGEAREVVLVPFVGARTVYGLNARVQGSLEARRPEAIAELVEDGVAA